MILQLNDKQRALIERVRRNGRELLTLSSSLELTLTPSAYAD